MTSQQGGPPSMLTVTSRTVHSRQTCAISSLIAPPHQRAEASSIYREMLSTRPPFRPRGRSPSPRSAGNSAPTSRLNPLRDHAALRFPRQPKNPSSAPRRVSRARRTPRQEVGDDCPAVLRIALDGGRFAVSMASDSGMMNACSRAAPARRPDLLRGDEVVVVAEIIQQPAPTRPHRVMRE